MYLMHIMINKQFQQRLPAGPRTLIVRLQTLIIGLVITLISCDSQTNTRISTENGYQEYFDNGFIKIDCIKKTASLEDKYFYNRYDSGLIDSLYQFRLFYDTIVPWKQYIYNSEQLAREIKIDRIQLDSGDFIKFELLNPRYDYISLHLRKNQTDRLSDTVYHNLPTLENPRHVLLRDPRDSTLTGFIFDWGIWSKTDTIGSIGTQVIRFLKFEIKDRTHSIKQ